MDICPICYNDVKGFERACSSCGVDLALAARTNELAIFESPEKGMPDVPMSPEVLVPRLGEHLVEHGYLGQDQLQSALDYQKSQSEKNSPILLGQALIHLGYIDQKKLDWAITQQIFLLQGALQKANIALEERVTARTRDLRKALERLSDLNQLKANFIANISHELRTPLTHIKGYTDMLRDASLGPVSDEQAEAYVVMDRSILRLETLIDDLIHFSKIDREDIILDLHSIQARSLVEYAFNIARGKSLRQNQKLSLQITGNLPQVICDQEKISWVILHLIENAIKFTPEGGMITVSAIQKGHQICFSITDSGIGIPEDRITEIFEPFHQLDTSTTRKYPGTGLGLALIERILDAHNSKIYVKSRPGEGSTFFFLIPIDEKSNSS